MKTCTECGNIKPYNEFHRNKTKRDGREARCKPCKKTHDTAYRGHRATDAQAIAEYNRDVLHQQP